MKQSIKQRNFISVDRASQRGVALVMGLVILLILTILGVSAMRTSSLQQLMSGNVQEMTRSLQTADSGASKVLLNLKTFLAIPSSGNSESFPYNVSGSFDSSTSTATIYKPITIQLISNFADRNGPANSANTSYAMYDQVVKGRSLGAVTVLQQNIRKDAPGGSSEFIN